MPGSSADQNILQQTVDGFAQRVEDYAQGIANRLGSPLSGVHLSPADAVARWNFSPLGSTVSADAQYFQLTSQGMPPSQALAQVYPFRAGLFSGQDINDSIAKATQIANWAADAAGVDRPDKPEPISNLPGSIIHQFMTGPAAAPPAPPAAVPPPVAGALPPGPAPAPMPPVQTTPGIEPPVQTTPGIEPPPMPAPAPAPGPMPGATAPPLMPQPMAS